MKKTDNNKNKAWTSRVWVKSVAGILSACVLAASPMVFAENENVVVGEKLTFDEGAEPIIHNERIMIPLRAVSKALDATVYWFNDTQTIQIVHYDTLLSLQIGNSVMGKYKIVNGEPSEESETISLEIAPMIFNDRTYIPLRAISEAFDASISWDNPNRSAIIIPSKIQENSITVKEMNEVPEGTLCSVYGVICLDPESGMYYLRSLTKNANGSYSQITFCTPKKTSMSDDTDYNEYVSAYWGEQFNVENPSGMVVKFTGVNALLGGSMRAVLNKTTTSVKALGYYDDYMKSLGLDYESFNSAY